MKCDLTINTTTSKDGKKWDNLVITTPNGTTFEVKYSFFNRKLAYKVKKEIEGNK